MVRKTILSAGLIAAAGMLAEAGTVNAQTVFSIGGSSGSYSGNVVFEFSPGQVTLTVFNNDSGAQSDGNGIIAIGFNLSGSPSLSINQNAVVGSQLLYNSGTLSESSYSVLDGGAGDPSGTPPTQSMTAPWTLSSSSFGGDSYLLGEISGGKPKDLVQNASGTPNASVGQHSPSLASGAVFTLDLSAVTAATTASNIKVYFGTDRSNGLPTGKSLTGTPVTPTPAPIPATLPLVGGGLLGLGLIALRKRRRLSQIR